MEDNKNEVIVENKVGKVVFFSLLGIEVTDAFVSVLGSYGLFLIIEKLMKLAGYRVLSEYNTIFYFIIFVVFAVLYKAVIHSKVNVRTVGEKLFS